MSLYFCAFLALLLTCFAIKNLCILDISVLSPMEFFLCLMRLSMNLPVLPSSPSSFNSVPLRSSMACDFEKLGRPTTELLPCLCRVFGPLLLLSTACLEGRWCLKSKGFGFLVVDLEWMCLTSKSVCHIWKVFMTGVRIISRYFWTTRGPNPVRKKDWTSIYTQ